LLKSGNGFVFFCSPDFYLHTPLTVLSTSPSPFAVERRPDFRRPRPDSRRMEVAAELGVSSLLSVRMRCNQVSSSSSSRLHWWPSLSPTFSSTSSSNLPFFRFQRPPQRQGVEPLLQPSTSRASVWSACFLSHREERRAAPPATRRSKGKTSGVEAPSSLSVVGPPPALHRRRSRRPSTTRSAVPAFFQSALAADLQNWRPLLPQPKSRELIVDLAPPAR
jgi:hypothetical protein